MPARPDLLIAVAPPPTPPDASAVLAVTAASVGTLAGVGVRYAVVDDVIDRADVLGADEEYVRWQLDWFGRLDDTIGATGAAVASAQKLKPVIDSVVIAARLAAAAIDRLGPDGIELVVPSGAAPLDPLHDGHLQFWPRLGDLSLWSSIVPLVAAARGIPLVIRQVDPTTPAAVPAPVFRDRMRASLAARTGLLRHFDIAHWRPRPVAGSTLMLWSGGYGARHLVAVERASGRRVVALERGAPTTRVFEPVPWGRRNLSSPVDVAPLGRGSSTAAAGVRSLLDDIDDRAGVAGVSDLLQSRVEAFAHRIVPVVASAAASLAPDLERLGIDSVVAANPSSIEEFAALLAAGRLGIDRTLAQHGDHLFSYDGWFVSEFANFDRFLASDATLVGDIPAAARRLGALAPSVRPSEHRGATRPSAVGARRQDGPVCYVPGVLMGDTAVRPSIYFDDSWYHRWHLGLLDWMRSRPDVRFIWKGLPSGDHVDDPIVDAIDAVRNVDYVTQPLPWLLGQVSRVVTDFPSTPAYEALRAGLPTIVLWFPRFAELRPTARVEFGETVRESADEAAALDHLSKWLVS